MSRSKHFEQRVSRIYRLLEADDCSVAWNDRIPDPDNPSQSRQVDILIRRQEQTVHVECRSHKTPQDVQWIEELIGRRISLAADQVIAVSDSGFTEGAKRKATRHGIVLRDLQMVTDAEVTSWGKRTQLEFCYYKLSNVQFKFEFEGLPPTPNAIGRFLFTRTDIVSSVMNSSKYLINTIEDRIFPLCIQTELNPFVPIEIEEVEVVAIKVRYEVDEVGIKHTVPTVFSYGSSDPEQSPDALVETHESINIEIIKSMSQCLVYIDLSTIPLPRTDQVFAGIVYLENVWRLSIDKVILVGNQELPVKLSTFELVIPPMIGSGLPQ